MTHRHTDDGRGLGLIARAPWHRGRLAGLVAACLLVAVGRGAAAEAAVSREKYGSAYLSYRSALQAEQEGQWEQARLWYAEVQGEPLAGMATVKRAEIAWRLGETTAARTALAGLVDGPPDRPGCLEAYLLLARMQYLEGQGDKAALATARATLAKGLAVHARLAPAWEEARQQRERLPALLLLLQDDDPLERVKRDFAVKTPMAPPRDRGWPAAELLFSAETCPWYLPWQAARLHLQEACFALAAGDLAGARRAHAAAVACYPLHDPALQAYGQRLAAGLERGEWLFPPELGQEFRRHAAPLRLAAFLAVSGETALAEPLFDRVLAEVKNRPAEAEVAGAVLGKLVCLGQRQALAEAAPLLEAHQRALQRHGQLATAHFLCQYAW